MEMNQDILRRIARLLMLRSSFISNIGLLNGKMGIAIFFFHYASYMQHKLYADFADKLIRQLYKAIHLDHPVDFEDGLAGIAWGIEYIIRNKFVNANADDVLEDLDKKILELDIRRVADTSLERGLKGIAHYVISRSANRENENLLISKRYIEDLIIALRDQEDEGNILLMQQLGDIINHNNVSGLNNLLFQLSGRVKYSQETLFNDERPLGILRNGYAGIGLNILRDSRL